MKFRIFLILLTIFFNLKSQNQRFLFEYKSIPDSLNPEKVESEIMALDVSEKFSKFYSYDNNKFDSISKSNVEKDISDTNLKFKKNRNSYIVIKEYPDFSVSLISRIGQTKYNVKDERVLKWNILSENDLLGNFKIQKAETEFGGRKWIAWFTTEIPIQDGPYKFRGLAGMILKISDVTDSHIFTLVGIQKLKNSISKDDNFVFDFGTNQNVTQEKYKQIFKEFRQDPNKSIRQTLSDMEEVNDNGKMVNKNYYLREREKRIKEQNKKSNNLLELDLLKN
ncbi:GLPGLI family protein [Epilithonimonas hominis]|uniref:GLPGLI family protein n=1 Tax=Epilithonimonas hominis TaxID=420404 RepID=UPI0028984AD5|nr:GLPGLI family protein [Epilithonimonas hominis]